MCVIEFDPCAVWEETQHRARKEYRCHCCRSRIEPGNLYRTIFAVDEDRGVIYEKSCAACGRDRDQFADEHDGQIPNPSSFQSVLNDCIQEGDRESETRWRPMLTAIQARNWSAV